MLETINPKIVFAFAGAIGGGLYGLYKFLRNRHENKKKLDFDVPKFLDTVWQSATLGIAFAYGELDVNYLTIAVTMVAGIGADKLTNELGFNPLALLKGYVKKKK